MRILWINEHGALTGGCERYIRDTVKLLNAQGVHSSLLYSARVHAEQAMLGVFEQAFPLVNLKKQVIDLAPDLIYLHRWAGGDFAATVAETEIPVVRFFHDHDLFCLRKRKYTGVRQRVCTEAIGLRCYPCLGFINRIDHWPGIGLSRVGALRVEQRENMKFQAFVVGSSYMAQQVSIHGFDRSKITVNPLYAAAPEYNPESITRKRDQLLFAGQLIRGKGLDVLLDALSRVRLPFQLLVAGSGKQEREYRVQSTKLGFGDRVQFLGRLNSDTLFEYYRRSACVVFPSRNPETFGLVGPEAMSQGAPVIASAIGGIGEWLDDGCTGIAVPVANPQALAEAIERVLGDISLQNAMSEAAVHRYRERFKPEHHVFRLMALFRQIVNNRGNG